MACGTVGIANVNGSVSYTQALVVSCDVYPLNRQSQQMKLLNETRLPLRSIVAERLSARQLILHRKLGLFSLFIFILLITSHEVVIRS